MRRLLVALYCLLTALSAGCSLPEGDQSSPEQAYYRFVTVRAAGDLDGLWELLHPDVRASFDAWHAAEREALKNINTRYPKSDQAAALAALGGGERAKLSDGKALFKRFASASPAEALGTLTSMGAHVRSETLADDGASARVRTYGGDELVFAKGADDRWYATLPADEQERLKNARERAERNAARIRKNLKKLAGD